jgi:CheY-like chemotaxis protein
MVRAIGVILDRGNPQLAKTFIDRLSALNLDPDAFVNLWQELGSAPFLRIRRTPELAPEGVQFADLVLDSAHAWATDRQRIVDLIDKLCDPDLNVRKGAMRKLWPAGATAVGPLAEVLKDPGQAQRHPYLEAALVALGPQTAAPVMSLLDDPDPGLRMRAIEVLGRLRAGDSGPVLAGILANPSEDEGTRTAAADALEQLSGSALTPDQATALVVERFNRIFDRLAEPRDGLSTVDVWQWNPETAECVSRQVPSVDADVLAAARLGRLVLNVNHPDPGVNRKALVAWLESEVLQSGVDSPLEVEPDTARALAASQGPQALEALLVEAMTSGHLLSARSVCQLLGRTATPAILTARGQKPSPIVLAARHGDRRLRFAALEAIMNLGPNQAYPGSSFVLESLGYFAASMGRPRVIVGHTNPSEATRLAGLFTQLGYEAEPVFHSRDLMQALVRLSDFELALVDINLPGAGAEQLLQELRRDYRTASLPVGLVASVDDLPRAQRMARHDLLAGALVRPVDARAMDFGIRQVLDQIGGRAVPQDERQRQSAQALAWIAEIGRQSISIYDLSRVEESATAALVVPDLGPRAVLVLAYLPRPTAQSRLADVASQATLPIELRETAGRAFNVSVRKWGNLLNTRQILVQYDRYNASERADERTQQVLASVLDSLELNASGSAPASAP